MPACWHCWLFLLTRSRATGFSRGGQNSILHVEMLCWCYLKYLFSCVEEDCPPPKKNMSASLKSEIGGFAFLPNLVILSLLHIISGSARVVLPQVFHLSFLSKAYMKLGDLDVWMGKAEYSCSSLPKRHTILTASRNSNWEHPLQWHQKPASTES